MHSHNYNNQAVKSSTPINADANANLGILSLTRANEPWYWRLWALFAEAVYEATFNTCVTTPLPVDWLGFMRIAASSGARSSL
jgi:hypothetical protein